MSEGIRILIADDHAIMRDGLQMILETVPEFTVAGVAADGAEAVRMAGELKPDVILMDLRMPVMDGISAIQQLQAERPEIAIIILTTYHENELILKGLKAGARGYLLKDTERNLLFNTIKAAVRGETLLSPEIMGQVLAHVDEGGETAPKAAGGLKLTKRELEVLQAAAKGMTSKEIAYNLQITERTIKAHLTSVYNKLGVDSRAAAIAEAAMRGWLTRDDNNSLKK